MSLVKGKLRQKLSLSPSSLLNLKRHWVMYLAGFVLPVAVFVIFMGYPIVYTVYISLVKWNGLTQKDFVGFSNYIRLFHDPVFWQTFANTVKWSVGAVIISGGVGLLLAVILSSNKLYFRTLFRTVLFLPVTISLVAIGIIFSLILNPSLEL